MGHRFKQVAYGPLHPRLFDPSVCSSVYAETSNTDLSQVSGWPTVNQSRSSTPGTSESDARRTIV